MKLFVPPLGTKLRLLEDWTPTLYAEGRNYEAWLAFEVSEPYYRSNGKASSVTILVPKDTILNVDRIFIRKGAENFDSMTFAVVNGPNKKLLTKKNGGTLIGKQCRFWVKLADTFSLDVEAISTPRRVGSPWIIF